MNVFKGHFQWKQNGFHRGRPYWVDKLELWLWSISANDHQNSECPRKSRRSARVDVSFRYRPGEPDRRVRSSRNYCFWTICDRAKTICKLRTKWVRNESTMMFASTMTQCFAPGSRSVRSRQNDASLMDKSELSKRTACNNKEFIWRWDRQNIQANVASQPIEPI